MKMYEMQMEFEVVLGLKEINHIMNMMGVSEKTGISGQSIVLTQTISFIPNEEYIHKVEDIIRENYKTDQFEILKCKFKGYKKFLEIEIDENEVEK